MAQSIDWRSPYPRRCLISLSCLSVVVEQQISGTSCRAQGQAFRDTEAKRESLGPECWNLQTWHGCAELRLEQGCLGDQGLSPRCLAWFFGRQLLGSLARGCTIVDDVGALYELVCIVMPPCVLQSLSGILCAGSNFWQTSPRPAQLQLGRSSGKRSLS